MEEKKLNFNPDEDPTPFIFSKKDQDKFEIETNEVNGKWGYDIYKIKGDRRYIVCRSSASLETKEAAQSQAKDHIKHRYL